ncbi:histone-like nucleoid-structuring protein Lsr2 [Rhodococcus sp. NPDC055024]
MAEIVIRELIDDLDEKSIDVGFGFEINFAYRGVDYRIDLRPANADKIDAAFAPFIQAAEKIRWASKVRAKSTGAVSRSGRSPEQFGAVREWASMNGFDVSRRGRIKSEVLDAFDAAN